MATPRLSARTIRASQHLCGSSMNSGTCSLTIGGSRQILKAVLEGKSQNFPRIDFSEHIENLFTTGITSLLPSLSRLIGKPTPGRLDPQGRCSPRWRFRKPLKLKSSGRSSQSTQWKARLLDENHEPIIGKTADVHEQKTTVSTQSRDTRCPIYLTISGMHSQNWLPHNTLAWRF